MQQVMQQTPIVKTTAGSIVKTGNNFLSSALDTWLQVERIKGARSSSGQDRIQAQVMPELQNGAAIQVDKTSADKAAEIKPFSISKNAVVIGGAVVVALLIVRYMQK